MKGRFNSGATTIGASISAMSRRVVSLLKSDFGNLWNGLLPKWLDIHFPISISNAR